MSSSFHYHPTLKKRLSQNRDTFYAVPEPLGSKFAYRFYFPEDVGGGMAGAGGRSGSSGGKSIKSYPIRDYRVAEYRE